MKLVAHAILCAAVLIAPSAATGGFNYDDYNVDDNNGGYLNGGYSNSASGRSQYGYDNFGDVDGAYASTYGRNEVPSLNSYSNHPSERLPSSYYTSGRYQNYPNRAMSSNTRTDASAASNQPVRSRYSRNVQPQNVDASLSSASGADNIKSGWHSRLNSRVYADQNQQYSAPIRSARKFSNAPQSSTAGNQPAVSSNSESSSSPAALVPQTQQQAPNFQNFDATPDQSNVVALGKQHTAIAPSARSSALTPQRVSPGSDVSAPADAPVSNSQDSNGQNYYPSSGTSSDQGFPLIKSILIIQETSAIKWILRCHKTRLFRVRVRTRPMPSPSPPASTPKFRREIRHLKSADAQHLCPPSMARKIINRIQR